MTTYRVQYRETVTFTVDVEADSAAEAKRAVRDPDLAWMQGESLPIAYGRPVVESVEVLNSGEGAA